LVSERRPRARFRWASMLRDWSTRTL
jgi:hypothetical protein